jgi:two-component system, OmpR family, sensor histidine kinase KdpD
VKGAWDLSPWPTAKWSAAGCGALALLVAVGPRLQLGFAAASFCCLLLIVAVSRAGNLVASALFSVASVACLDYFFVEPLYSFRIAKPLNALALASFLVTGLVIAHLTAKARVRLDISRLHHEKLQGLYELAQQLLSRDADMATDRDFLAPFLGVFGVQGVCLFDATSAELHIAGHASDLLETKTGDAFVRGRDEDDFKNRIFVRSIRVAGRTTGAIGFAGLEDPAVTAGPLAALAAAHLERAHSFHKASRAAAEAQTESYRSAILDALAHEFKTPLATILAAAGALREADSLDPNHRMMAETVESETARLSRLTSRLIRTARLEQEEVKPWMELMDVSSAVDELVEQYAKLAPERTISVIKECDSSEVLADPQLVRLAVSQLLDNACKYSLPGSAITVEISRERDAVVARVLSSGEEIPPAERQKIFDRFYRGSGGRRMAHGSGLGLYVARKIALAHGGSLDLESGRAGSPSFCLMLPVPESERRERVAKVSTAV